MHQELLDKLKQITEEERRILEGKDRTKLGATAPAQGLCLEEVFYSEERLQSVLTQLKAQRI